MEHEADRDMGRLYPAFRARLKATLVEAAATTGHEWVMLEGYRSPARQTWLYAQGRTRPGRIVTWMKRPVWHGAGLAADVAPLKGQSIWWDAPRSVWEALREAGRRHGLVNPAWSKGDLGHLQIGDPSLRAAAEAWVKRGFCEAA